MAVVAVLAPARRRFGWLIGLQGQGHHSPYCDRAAGESPRRASDVRDVARPRGDQVTAGDASSGQTLRRETGAPGKGFGPYNGGAHDADLNTTCQLNAAQVQAWPSAPSARVGLGKLVRV